MTDGQHHRGATGSIEQLVADADLQLVGPWQDRLRASIDATAPPAPVTKADTAAPSAAAQSGDNVVPFTPRRSAGRLLSAVAAIVLLGGSAGWIALDLGAAGTNGSPPATTATSTPQLDLIEPNAFVTPVATGQRRRPIADHTYF